MNSLDADLKYIYDRITPIMPSLEGSHILITGGTGFFGRWLLMSLIMLIKQGHAIKATILSRDPNKFIASFPELNDFNQHITFIKGDVRNCTYPNEAFTHVIHAATAVDANMSANAPTEMLNTVLGGTEHLLNFCASLTQKPQILFISSGAVYGQQPAEITHLLESFKGAPNIEGMHNTYGISKYVAEHLCYQYHRLHNLDIKIARPFAFVGPYLPLDIHFAIGNFIRDALNNNPINISGDGSTIRSYQYAADLVIWLWYVLLKGKNCYPYNIGSEEAYDLKTVAHKISEKFSSHPKVIISKEKTVDTLASRYIPSTQRILTELNVPNNLTLDEALDRTILWYNHNKN